MIKITKNQKIYNSKQLVILTLMVLVLFGCTDEKDKKIAELTKKFEEQSKLIEEQPKQKEQAIAKQDMKLQEECAKGAYQYYNRYTFAEGGYHNYTNHYNKKNNKCYILGVEIDNGTTTKLLVDINENKDYGHYFLLNNSRLAECWVNDKQCKSEIQWDALAKPYMEE